MKIDRDKVINQVMLCDDPDKLRKYIKNAKRMEETEIESIAFHRLIEVLPSNKPGTLEHDFWKTIHTFEELLTEERGKTTRLQRTRQKVKRVGEKKTLIDWCLNTIATDGFQMLLERDLLELSGEAIVLRHEMEFDDIVIRAARRRLNLKSD